MGVVASAGEIIGAVGTCTGDCIGVVAGAGVPKEAVCSKGETAELISGVKSTGKTDGKTSSL